MSRRNYGRAQGTPGDRLDAPPYWPVALGEPPRLDDGSVDVLALCRQWDDAVNAGCPTTPGLIERGGQR